MKRMLNWKQILSNFCAWGLKTRTWADALYHKFWSGYSISLVVHTGDVSSFLWCLSPDVTRSYINTNLYLYFGFGIHCDWFCLFQLLWLMILKWLSLYISSVKRIIFNMILFRNKLMLTSTVVSIECWLNGQDWKLVIESWLNCGKLNFKVISCWILGLMCFCIFPIFSQADWQCQILQKLTRAVQRTFMVTHQRSILIFQR